MHFLVSVQRKKRVFLSHSFCLSLYSFFVFFALFPNSCFALSLSLSHSLFPCGCFLFFSLSLSLSVSGCRAVGSVPSLILKRSYVLVFDGCQRATRVATTIVCQPAVIYYSIFYSIRRPIDIQLVFDVNTCIRHAFRYRNGFCRFCYYCSLFVTVIIVKHNYYSNWLNNNNNDDDDDDNNK